MKAKGGRMSKGGFGQLKALEVVEVLDVVEERMCRGFRWRVTGKDY